MTYSVKTIDETLVGTFDSYNEAQELVRKYGDKSKLAYIEKSGVRLYGDEQ